MATIAHFTVTVANEAGVDLVLIQPFLLYYAKLVVVMPLTRKLEKEGGLFQNKVNLSLTFTQRLGHQAHNCKVAYLSISRQMGETVESFNALI